MSITITFSDEELSVLMLGLQERKLTAERSMYLDVIYWSVEERLVKDLINLLCFISNKTVEDILYRG